tara:strand:- start:326 stop:775 length:450 start_codon:yes stop_codon:yes gene_type:complete
MKYTKGGFPFKSSPAKQSKKNEYNRENNQTADNSGPVRPVSMVATDKRKFEQSELVGDLDDKTEYVDADIENKKVSLKKGNAIKKELQNKADKLRSQEYKNHEKYSDLEKHDDDRPVKPKPSFKATPKGSKQRSKAEKALEKSEDEKGY